MNNKTKYSSIFKTTFLFSFVKVFLILSKIGLTKVASIFLGPSGIGLIGLYDVTIKLISTFSGLGIYQSSVRDISELDSDVDKTKVSKIISLTNGLILCSAILGSLITIIFSSFFSFWTFGNTDHQVSFVFLSAAVFFTVLNEGRLAVLKGKRKHKYLAKANILGSIFSFILGSLFYYVYGVEGVVYSLIVMSFSVYIFSEIYVRKINFNNLKLTVSDYINNGSDIVRMGLSLMYISLSIIITEYIIKAYILNVSNIEMVGLFQAGSTMVMGYFGIITTAMATDYYPRISAINRDNAQLCIEVNKQSKVGLVLLGPLVTLFLFLMPFLVESLYSKAFLSSIDYISYAIFGVILISCSNSMGMVLIAKRKPKIFLSTISFNRFLLIFLSIYSFKFFGLKGLGVSYLIFSISELILMQIVLGYFYKIKINFETIKILITTFIFSFSAFMILQIPNLYIRFILGFFIIIMSCIYSIKIMKDVMNISLLKSIKKYFY